MELHAVLIVSFFSFFFLLMAVLNIASNSTKTRKRIYSSIHNVRFKDVEKKNYFDGLKDNLIRIKFSDNIAYLYASIASIITFFIFDIYVEDTLSKDFEMLTLFAPLTVFVLIPFFYKKIIKEMRDNEVLSTLPVVIDLLIICLEAGLSFSASIDKIVDELRKKKSFLLRHLRLTVYELNAGVDKRASLRNLVSRCYGQPDLKSFVSAVIQSESFGFSIVRTLRVQAAEIRDKKRQMLRTRIAKMPVKLLFPLVFCIFPITCLLLVGPGFIEILKALR